MSISNSKIYEAIKDDPNWPEHLAEALHENNVSFNMKEVIGNLFKYYPLQVATIINELLQMACHRGIFNH
jgi:hypothetical protein